MKILEKDIFDKSLVEIEAKCDIFYYLVEVNATETLQDVLTEINDETWLNELDIIDSVSYRARREKTVKKMVYNITHKRDDFEVIGEYIVSKEGRRALECGYGMKSIPLAELWKERVSGNGSFDFHAEDIKDFLIVFGEAKYNSHSNPYDDAIDQVNRFIDDKKDKQDLVDLKPFANKQSLLNCINGKKSFAISFSIKAQNKNLIIKNAVKYCKESKILDCDNLYVIGVVINDK